MVAQTGVSIGGNLGFILTFKKRVCYGIGIRVRGMIIVMKEEHLGRWDALGVEFRRGLDR